MNKKSLVLILSIVAVVALFFLLRRNTGNTLSGNDRNFEFSNTDKIDKIFLSNRYTREHILLTKTGKNEWLVNDTFKASIYQLDIFLEGLRKMRVKRPASKREIEQVKKDFVLNGIKTEIYENGKLSKVFYVGKNTGDEMGTWFIMENAEEPYVCNIPGFNGYLNARYYTKKEAWRSKNIFSLKDDEIKTVELNWTGDKKASFKIDNSGSEPVLSSNSVTFRNNVDLNLNLLRTYLNLWENLSFEGFPVDLDPHKIDSISKTAPILTIQVIDKNGKSTSLSIHKKGIKKDSNIQFDDQGNPLQFDIETYYALINGNTKEVVQIQDYIFGKVMKRSSDFLLKP